MKILHVSPSFPYPPNDGGKIVIYNLYKFLRNSGDEVDFICLSKQKINEDSIKVFDPDNTPEIFIDEKISSLSRLLRALLSRQSYLISKFYSKRFLSLLESKLKENKYDIVHFEGLHTSLYALQILQRFDTKVVLRLHNIESLIIKRFYENSKNPFLKLVLSSELKKITKIESEAFRKIKNIVFISELDKKISGIINYPDANPFVSPAGVDYEYFQMEKTKNNNLLFLGSMDWRPNENAVIWFVEKVFSKIIKDFPLIMYYVVGKNPSGKIKNFEGNNIVVTGTVKDVRPYLEKTGICIVPLFIGGGMRVKILEFMASGRPVISTSVGAEGINYTDGMDILLADNETEFISKIIFLINNPVEKEKIIENAKKLILNEYTWEKVIFKYRIFLSKVIH
jgi:polysaccharide biosynthesis protein PslH